MIKINVIEFLKDYCIFGFHFDDWPTVMKWGWKWNWRPRGDGWVHYPWHRCFRLRTRRDYVNDE